MFKKSLLVGSMAAVIAVLLIFAGCSQSDDPVAAAGPDIYVGDGTIINLQGGISAEDLNNALFASPVVTLIGDYNEVVTLFDSKDGLVLPTALHISDTRTLVIGQNVTLVLDDDDLFIEGTLKVTKGGILVLRNDGALNPDAEGDLMGELIIEDGGILIDAGGVTLWGNDDTEGLGKAIFKPGSVGYFGGADAAYWTSGPPSVLDLSTASAKAQKVLGPKGDADATFALLDGEIILKKDGYRSVNGSVMLTDKPVASGIEYTILAGDVLEIAAGKTLTIPTGAILALETSATPGISGGKITGAGKVVAGKTEIVGGPLGWRAAGGAAGEFMQITAEGDTLSRIFRDTTTGAVVLAGSAGATITQKAGLAGTGLLNRLYLGLITAVPNSYDGIIELGGTFVEVGAQIILEGDTDGADADELPDYPGALAFTTGNSSWVRVDAPTGTPVSPFTAVATIGGKPLVKLATSSPAIHTRTPNSPGYFWGAKGPAGSGITGGFEGLTLDSTKLVAAAAQ